MSNEGKPQGISFEPGVETASRCWAPKCANDATQSMSILVGEWWIKPDSLICNAESCRTWAIENAWKARERGLVEDTRRRARIERFRIEGHTQDQVVAILTKPGENTITSLRVLMDMYEIDLLDARMLLGR